MRTSGNDKQIPALDGLRALAVLAVIGYHLFPRALPGGYIGVDLFFVISGFLITTLLVAEHARAGKVRFKNFWLRRARRLLPALAVVILSVSSVMFFMRGDVSVGLGRQIIGALTFSSNWLEVVSGTDYFNATAPHLFLNFWSLGVEEQFYLVWPVVALALLTVYRRPRIGMALTLLAACGSAIWMAYAYVHGTSASRLYYGTDTHAFGLMTGAFLAFWARSNAPDQALRRLYAPFSNLQNFPKASGAAAIAAAGGWTVLACTMNAQSSFAYLGGLLLATLLSAVLIVVGAGSGGVVTKVLSLAPLRWIGRRSYGLYLWHWPLLVLTRLWLPHASAGTVALALIPLTFGLAALSYRFVEEPVRRNGFKATFKKAFPSRSTTIDAVTTRVSHRPHVALIPFCLAAVLTIGAVITAPAKTSAQLRIETGQQRLAHQSTPVSKDTPPRKNPSSTQKASAIPSQKSSSPQDGSTITAIGDSVMVACSPIIQTRFPGIFINAVISRSMRMGGLETIETMKQRGELRKTVIVALGTNGYFGTGLLDRMIRELQGHNIVLVTAHADREWTVPNNDDAHKAAAAHTNVAIAEWDQAITSHPELLSEDGIHPVTAQGDAIYADSIAAALRKFH
jgi:peptidoglycan/LPS O-acetylase OafA/YrhL